MIFVSHLRCAKSDSDHIFLVLALLRENKSFPLFQGVYVFMYWFFDSTFFVLNGNNYSIIS